MNRPAVIQAVENGLNSAGSSQRLYVELVRALYSTPKSIISAAIIAMGITLITGLLSKNWVYGGFFVAFAIVGAIRCAAVWLYMRANHEDEDLAAVKWWERVALVGAWAFAGLIGLIAAYTMTVHSSTEIEILISCSAMGYIAGISSRNASRPMITIGQISAICVPFAIALIVRADVVHLTLAAFVGLLYVSTVIMSRTMHENIVARHRALGELEVLALHDALTGLLNRTAFIQLLDYHLAREARRGVPIALLSIDLDRFKDVNDTFGHAAGDAVLRETASRIASVLKTPHEISRIGGDEFLVILKGMGPAEASKVAERILAKLCAPMTIGMTAVSYGASAGIAVAPTDGSTLEDLMRNADLALYAAKSRGRGQVVTYEPMLSELYQDRIALEHDLQSAVANGDLELLYQPIVDPRSGRAICCEALIRWNHPARGTIPPADFIPIAEASGLIIPIGTWALKTACAEAAFWPNDVKVAVNLSPIQFKRGREIIETVKSALREANLPPYRLELEVTETVLIEETAATLALIEELRREGVGVSLDDLGIGFSSLAYLSDFPFSKVKIDRKFTKNIGESHRTTSIIKGIAQITRDLGIELVAEGVETVEQLDYMRNLKINAIQGYLFSMPVPAHQLRRLIKKPLLIDRLVETAPTAALGKTQDTAA